MTILSVQMFGMFLLNVLWYLLAGCMFMVAYKGRDYLSASELRIGIGLGLLWLTLGISNTLSFMPIW